MHSAAWQAVCGFYTDVYESLNRDDVSMRYIFETMCQHGNEKYALWTENGKKRQYTYGELPVLCASAARQLDDLVSAEGGIIALHMANSAMWPVIFWAILMTGHTPLLLNASLPLRTFEKVMEGANTAAVISEEPGSGAIHPDMLLKSAVRADIALFEKRWEDKVIFMTSGTTGKAKLLVFTGNCFAKQILSCRYFYRDTLELAYPKNNGILRQLALLPFSHIFGFTICVLWYSFFGRQLVYPVSLRPDHVIEACRKQHVTHFCAVPSYFDILAQIMEKAARRLFGKHADGFLDYLKEGKLAAPELYQRYQSYAKKLCNVVLGGGIRYMISGGGMLSAATAGFFNRLGLYFCNGYGMTELGVLAVEKSELPERRMQCSIGQPSYGVKFTLDERGEIWVDCDYAAVGYLENGGIVPLEKPFSTKDIARRLSDGRYMLIGRCDDVIIDSDGNRLHPAEIEERLRRIHGVACACVIHTGTKLVALLEADTSSGVEGLCEGIDRANALSPVAQCIQEAWICRGLLRTSKGDADRRAMAEAYAHGLTNAVELKLTHRNEGTALSEPMIDVIRKKVAAVLSVEVEQVMPDSGFFTELGMDSLTYMCFVQWLEDEYHLPFTVPGQRRFETVYQCAEYIKNGGVTK